MIPERNQWTATERWLFAIGLLGFLAVLGMSVHLARGQALSSFGEVSTLSRGDKVPALSTAGGSNLNVWITQSNFWSQMATSLVGSGSITVAVSAAAGTITFSGSVDASMSNSLVSLLNTASNALNAKITVASNTLLSAIYLNSNNLVAASNNFRAADTALSNSVAAASNALVATDALLTAGLTALTNAKANRTNGTLTGATLATTATNAAVLTGAGVNLITNITGGAFTNLYAGVLVLTNATLTTNGGMTNLVITLNGTSYRLQLDP